MTPNNFKDLTGKRFGRLIVINRIDNTQYGKVQWLCKCDCGKESKSCTGSLLNGATFSCGCYRRDKHNDYVQKQQIELLSRPPYKMLYNVLLSRAKRRKIKVELTYEELLEFVKIKKCHYCGGEIEWIAHHTRNKYPSKYNLDRVDRLKGYSKENCVVCCYRCNVIKNDMSREEFLNHIKKIINHQSK